MKIIVPPDLQWALTEQAQKRGKAPEDLAVEALRERFVPCAAPVESAQTLADFLADHVGILSSGEIVTGGAGMSQNGGKKFADALKERREQGRL